MCFVNFLGKRTLCDAYHKEHVSHQPAFLDISDTVISKGFQNIRKYGMGKDKFSEKQLLKFVQLLIKDYFSRTASPCK